jgi:cytochrome c553
MRLFGVKDFTSGIAALFLLVGCGSNAADQNNSNSAASANASNGSPVVEYSLTAGRLLASQCAQCHGTNGNSVNGLESLAGSDEVYDEMLEIRAGDEDPIMQAQAHGYTLSEIGALAAYFAQAGGSGGSGTGDNDGRDQQDQSGNGSEDDQEYEEDHRAEESQGHEDDKGYLADRRHNKNREHEKNRSYEKDSRHEEDNGREKAEDQDEDED